MKPYILVEPFCGMAALSFGLMGCQPPISWMGSKRGYCRVLMELLGLSRHNPPAAFIWGDVGPNVAALATLAGARGDAREVAGWLAYRVRTHPGGGGFLTTQDYNTNKARKPHNVRVGGVNYHPESPAPQVESLPLPRAHEVAAIIRGWKDEEPRALWERLKAAGWPSLMPPKGARWGRPIVGRWLGPVAVEEVAGFMWAATRSYKVGQPESGFKSAIQPKTGTHLGGADYQPDSPAPALDALPARWPRVACYQGTATRLVEQLPGDLSGFLIYVDGPYHGDGSRKITGYKFGGCSREEQLRMAADCHRRGARVAMSESVPLAAELRALTGDEWWQVDITEHREGQSRTFGATREYVTLNAAPLHMRGTQQGLFGGGR